MDVNGLRKDFPLLEIGGECPIYFDNACMTLRPRQVISKIVEYYSEYPGCGGRSLHRISNRVTEEFEGSRDIISGFLNAPDRDSILFTKNTTEAINLVSMAFPFKKGDLVIGTDHEHNSNLVPWLRLKARGLIEYQPVPSDPEYEFDIETFKEIVKGAALVSMVHVSNLDGRRIPEKEIVDIAHDRGVPVLLDAAQSVPHMKVDMKDIGVDMLTFSGHKVMGPTGTGVLACDPEILKGFDTFLVGGDTVKETTYERADYLPPPKRFEAGLQHFAGFIGLGEALRYLDRITLEEVHHHEVALNRYATDLLENKVRVMGPKDPSRRSGIFPFIVDGLNSHDIAMMLDDLRNIAIRSGHHCVHSWFNSRHQDSTARASFYLYNTKDEIKLFADTLESIVSDFT